MVLRIKKYLKIVNSRLIGNWGELLNKPPRGVCEKNLVNSWRLKRSLNILSQKLYIMCDKTCRKLSNKVRQKLFRGVTGNTSDSESEEWGFETLWNNKLPSGRMVIASVFEADTHQGLWVRVPRGRQ